VSLAARIGSAIFWGQAGRLAEAAAFFLFSLVLARVLGPASYGLYALGASLAGLCGFLTLLGLGQETLGRFLPEIARGGRPDRVRRLLGNLLMIRMAAILLLAAVVASFRREIAGRIHFSSAVAPIALVLFLFAARSVSDLLTYFRSGLLDLRRVACAKVVAALVAPLLFLLFVAAHRASTDAAWLATAAGSVAGILILAIPFLAACPRTGVADPIPLGRILAFGIFTWATNFFVYVLSDNTDVLLLGWLLADRAAIGCYAVGAKIVFSLTWLLVGWAPLVSVATFSEAWQHGGIQRLAALVEAQWKLTVLCVLPPLLLLVRYAREVVIIFYSPAYAQSAGVARILGGLMICAVVCGFSLPAGVLWALSRERVACLAVAGAAVFNVVAEIAFVRRIGIDGAAWATGLSFVLLAIVCAVASRALVPWRFPARFIAKVTASAVLGMASTLWLNPDSLLTFGRGCALYGAVFFGCLVLLKPLSDRDSAGLHRVNERLGAWAAKLFVDLRATVEEG
jgi:O-antigen/teichoic acid export membrane protein